MNADLQPGSMTLSSIRHVARLQRINEQEEGQRCLTGTRSSSHSAIVAGNATYWDLSRLYR